MRSIRQVSYRSGFTLIELLVVIGIIGLLIGILLPALGAAKTWATRVNVGVDLRTMHQACFVFGESNNGYYPGLSSDGEVLSGSQIPSAPGHHSGAYVVPRFSIMVDSDLIPAEHIVSPNDPTREVWTEESGDPIRHRNISYAALDIYAAGQNSLGRASWRSESGANTPIFSERNTGTSHGPDDSSLWSKDGWQGAVVWNDGHTTFESTPVVSTELDGQQIREDNLFDGNSAAIGGYGPGQHVRMIKREAWQTVGPYGNGSGLDP